MTISVLTRTEDGSSLGRLHDRVGHVDQESLPCRINNP